MSANSYLRCAAAITLAAFTALPGCSSGSDDANAGDPAVDDDGGTEDTLDVAGAIEGDPEQDEDGGALADVDQTAIYDSLPSWDDAVDGDSGAPGSNGSFAGTTSADDLRIDTGTGLVTGQGSLLVPCKRADGYIRGRKVTVCVTMIDKKLVSTAAAGSYNKMKAANGALHVVSGFRTYQEQVNLYNLYKSGRGNLAAKPGYSNHESGLALDLNTSARNNYAWMVKNGATFGFRRTVPSEKWHWEI